MKVSSLFTLLATVMAASATASPAAKLDERAAVKYNAREAAALEAQTRSTINQLRNTQQSYENRARSVIGGWSGSARTSIQQDLQRFDQAIQQSNEALQHIASVLARLH